MNGFVDATDPASVEAVLRAALPAVGVAGVLAQLAQVPGLQVEPGRSGGLFRAAVPAQVGYRDRTLRWDPAGPVDVHMVGGIVLSTEPVVAAGVAALLADLVTRAVRDHEAGDAVSVGLTALRDAVQIG